MILALRNWVNCSIYQVHDVSAIDELLKFLDYSMIHMNVIACARRGRVYISIVSKEVSKKLGEERP